MTFANDLWRSQKNFEWCF